MDNADACVASEGTIWRGVSSEEDYAEHISMGRLPDRVAGVYILEHKGDRENCSYG